MSEDIFDTRQFGRMDAEALRKRLDHVYAVILSAEHYPDSDLRGQLHLIKAVAEGKFGS